MLANTVEWTENGIIHRGQRTFDRNVPLGIVCVHVLFQGEPLVDITRQFPGLIPLVLCRSQIIYIKIKEIDLREILVLAPIEFGLGVVKPTVLYHEGMSGVYYSHRYVGENNKLRYLSAKDYVECEGLLYRSYISR